MGVVVFVEATLWTLTKEDPNGPLPLQVCRKTRICWNPTARLNWLESHIFDICIYREYGRPKKCLESRSDFFDECFKYTGPRDAYWMFNPLGMLQQWITRARQVSSQNTNNLIAQSRFNIQVGLSQGVWKRVPSRQSSTCSIALGQRCKSKLSIACAAFRLVLWLAARNNQRILN